MLDCLPLFSLGVTNFCTWSSGHRHSTKRLKILLSKSPKSNSTKTFRVLATKALEKPSSMWYQPYRSSNTEEASLLTDFYLESLPFPFPSLWLTLHLCFSGAQVPSSLSLTAVNLASSPRRAHWSSTQGPKGVLSWLSKFMKRRLSFQSLPTWHSC